MIRTERTDKVENQQTGRMTKKGTNPANNQGVLAVISSEEVQRIETAIAEGRWHEELEKTAQKCSLTALTQVIDAIETGRIKPEFLSKVALDSFGISQTMAGQASSIQGNLSLQISGKDLTRSDIMTLIQGRNKQSK